MRQTILDASPVDGDTITFLPNLLGTIALTNGELLINKPLTIQGSATLKSVLGSSALALDQLIYGLLLILFIIYMPKGVIGTLAEKLRPGRKP